ncbi:MAG: CotH kinase family protein, partial [Planctomycetota bacterium]
MASKIKNALGLAWRWSLLLTVPIASVFLVWAYRTGAKYVDLGVKFETFNNHMSLHRIGTFEAEAVMRDLRLAVRPREFDSGTALRTMELFVPEASENRLNGELPHSGREYVPASLQYPNGEIGEVKLRYRGDHFWHWGARKKSLRVKTKKKALFERIRAINFSAPKTKDQIVEQLSNELALRFDLIGPRSELVDLRVNGRNRGIHLLVEQLEEMVIRTNGKMPGDLYAADIVKRSAYAGLGMMVFRNPALWEKSAINNHFDEGEDGNLRRLIEVLQREPSAERTRALRKLVDIESFGRFGAFRAVCQTFHFDDTHNQRLYYDPWRNCFLPVVWDSVGWHPGALPRNGQLARPDVVTSDLDLALFQDPLYLAARQRAFEDWFQSGKHESFLERVD